MPFAEEAANFEDKIKTVLFDGVDALPKLQNRGSVELKSTYPAYIRDQVKRCTDQA